MAKNVFSVPIFFIVFREVLEASIIVSVLLGLAEQIVREDPGRISGAAATEEAKDSAALEDETVQRKRLIRKLRIQVRHIFT